MTEITIGANVYNVGKLVALDQYHVARRYAPVLFMLAEGKDIQPEGAAKAMVALSGRVPQEDADFVVNKCLSTASRKQPGGYAPVMAGGQLMFADLSMNEMLQLVYHVLVTNGIISFFVTTPSATAKPAGSSS